MEKHTERSGTSQVVTEVVDLFKSENNNSSTHAFHFNTDDTNQFCDFTEKIESLVKKSSVKHGSITIFTPHTTTAVLINESETGYINDFNKK